MSRQAPCHGQLCLPGQFCSENDVNRGWRAPCRNCSDIAQWCERDPAVMAARYPRCSYLCQDEVSANGKHTDTREDLLSWTMGALGVVIFLSLVIAVAILLYYQREKISRFLSRLVAVCKIRTTPESESGQPIVVAYTSPSPSPSSSSPLLLPPPRQLPDEDAVTIYISTTTTPPPDTHKSTRVHTDEGTENETEYGTDSASGEDRFRQPIQAQDGGQVDAMDVADDSEKRKRVAINEETIDLDII